MRREFVFAVVDCVDAGFIRPTAWAARARRAIAKSPGALDVF
jgi:hypothetical protein